MRRRTVASYQLFKRIRTQQDIRTMRSVRVNTGPGRHAWWPRLRETERLAAEEAVRQIQRHRPGRWQRIRVPKARRTR
jgi:hypothetical protein